MKITKKNAETMIQAYKANGTTQHFILENGKPIKGYIFDKTELRDLMQLYDNNQLYLMLGLNDHATLGPHITVIIGSIKEDGKIDPDKLIYSDPYTDNLTMGKVPLGTKKRFMANGHPIDQDDAVRMINAHLIDRLPLNLTSPTGGKLEAFNLYDNNLEYLFKGHEPNNFMILPALKDKNKDNTPVSPKHLTLILTWFEAGNVYTVKMLEYCLPCPSACHSF